MKNDQINGVPRKDYMRQYMRQWRKRRPKYYREYQAKYQAEHRDELQKKKNARYIRKPESEKVTKNRNYEMWNRARRRAKEFNVPFTISLDDIVIPEKCPYLGTILGKSNGHSSASSASLDRIIPELGYVPGNIQVISMKANLMKQNATIEELRTFAENVLKIH